MEKKRLYNIDFLRIVLINAIIIHHFVYAATGHWNSGGRAVEFFFLIAGFLFNLTYKIKKTTIDFIIGKLIRFMPLLICTSLTLAFCTKFEAQKFLADLFLLQKTGLYAINNGFSYDDVAWFISVLFWVLLFIFYLRKSTNEKITNLILGFLVFFSLIILANKVNLLYPDPRIFRGLASVGIGYFCAEITKALPQICNQIKSKLITFFEVGIFSYLSYILFTSYKLTNIVGTMFLMGVLIILFYYQKGYFSSFLNKPVFTKISTYVFPLYITHAIFYYPHPFFKYFYQVCNNVAVICLVGIGLSWVFSVIVHHLIEQPATKYLTKLYKEAQTRVALERERERERERESSPLV